MTAKDRSSLRKLKHLIAVCRSGEDGFRTAAANAENPALHMLFEFAADLQSEVRQLAEEIGTTAKRQDSDVLSPAWLKLL